MSVDKTKEELEKHREQALSKLQEFIDSMIQSDDPSERSKADKLAFWVEDYTRLLKREQTYNPMKALTFKRGDVISVNLGFRLGHEEGGLHYAIVIDNSEQKSSGLLTIIPLTSKKPGKKPNSRSVDLGDEIFRSVISKADKLQNEINNTLADINRNLEESNARPDIPYLSSDKLQQQLISTNKKLDRVQDLRKGILKMKSGSIALIGQITTISKIRLYDPEYSSSFLYGIRVSPTTLSAIDEKIRELYLPDIKTQK